MIQRSENANAVASSPRTSSSKSNLEHVRTETPAEGFWNHAIALLANMVSSKQLVTATRNTQSPLLVHAALPNLPARSVPSQAGSRPRGGHQVAAWTSLAASNPTACILHLLHREHKVTPICPVTFSLHDVLSSVLPACNIGCRLT